MRTKIMKFEEATQALQFKARSKYVDDPANALVKIPALNGIELTYAIDVWYLNHHYLLIVNQNELRNLEWDSYLEHSDDGVFLPFWGLNEGNETFDNEYFY